MSAERFVPVRLARVVLRDGADQQWIFLQEVAGERGFPIVIGNSEASEIHRVLANEPLTRPLTHQLALAAVEALGSKLVRVDVVDLRNNTFFARLVLAGVEAGVREVHVDARPSDALALALRAGAPLRVAESVLEQARTDRAPDDLTDDSEDDTPGAPPESD
jgi:bifunctional DNase/RNase